MGVEARFIHEDILYDYRLELTSDKFAKLTVGEKITLKARLTRKLKLVGREWEPVSGERVDFYILIDGDEYWLGYTTTDDDGVATFKYTLTEYIEDEHGEEEARIPCRKIRFRAEAKGVQDETDSLWASYRTRISIDAPRLTEDTEVEVRVKLEYHDGDDWRPLPGQKVYIYRDNVKAAHTYTDTNGEATARVRLREGVNTLEARFCGIGGPYNWECPRTFTEARTQAAIGIAALAAGAIILAYTMQKQS